MIEDRQSTHVIIDVDKKEVKNPDQKKQDWKLFLDLRLRLISGFKNLRKNFKIKIRWIIWFSYPFLTSGRLTQFLMRGVRWPGTVPLVLQTLRIQRSALQWLRQLYANFPPTLRQHACSQYKGNLMVHCWNFPASRSKPKAEWEKKIPYLYKSTKTSKGFYQIRSSLKARAY